MDLQMSYSELAVTRHALQEYTQALEKELRQAHVGMRSERETRRDRYQAGTAALKAVELAMR